MRATKKTDDERTSSTKLNSKHAAIFFITLAALVMALVIAIWVANQYSHFLDR